ncbi:MAG: roadblock/LC7 domain-containing protein [Candidatus Thorarchaeota archaeon]|nr:roadblock/LC7 domain-containing protein [Candidatus Thorarchaeota archaeon]
MSSKTEILTGLLEDLSRASQGNIQASLIISRSQGLTICSHYPIALGDGLIPDEDVIAGRTTQIQMATGKVFKELKRGPLVRMLIEGDNGYVIIGGAGDDAILAVLTNRKVNLGYLFFMLSKIAREIAQTLT